MTTGNPFRDLEAARRVAGLLGMVIEEDVCSLAEVTPGTLEAWAKRGTGPTYSRIGNRRLYPLSGLREFLEGRSRAKREN